MMKMHCLSDVCEGNWRALQVTVATLLKGNDEKWTTPYAQPPQPLSLILFSTQEDENIQHKSCSYHGCTGLPILITVWPVCFKVMFFLLFNT